MPSYPVTEQIKTYFDGDGKPLESGYIYFGQPGLNPETSPIQMTWDAAGLIPAPQPFRTKGGKITRNGVPSNVFAPGDCSSTVYDSARRLVYTVRNSTDIQLALAVVGAGTASAITVDDAAAYYTAPKNVENILQQVGASLAAVALGAIPTGVKLSYCGGVSPATPPTGFVFASGRTIGSAASSATERNNADTANLYTLLWNNYGNTELPIQDSAGTPTTRGASAAADFAANKRLPVPDSRCRVDAGLDNMGGSGTTSRLTAAGANIVGTTMGAAGGAQTHTLNANEMPVHGHAITDAGHNHTQNAHTHTQNAHTHTQDAHTHTQDAHDHAISDAGHVHQYNSTNTTALVRNDVASITVALPSSVQNTGNAPTGISVVISTATNQNATATNQNATATNQNATATNIAATTGISINNAGSGTAHQNTQPTIMYTMIIKL